MKKPTAEELLKEAKKIGEGRRTEGYHDDKRLVFCTDFLTLLEAGADAKVLNKPEGKSYYHELVYKGHRFIAATKKPIEEFKKYQC